MPLEAHEDAPGASYHPELSILQDAPYSTWLGFYSPKHHYTLTRRPSIGEMTLREDEAELVEMIQAFQLTLDVLESELG